MSDHHHRLVAVALDEKTIPRSTADREHERAIAIFDLVERNSFAPKDHHGGPYALTLSIVDGKIHFDVKTPEGQPVCAPAISMTALRRILRDYLMVCETYYAAIRTHTPAQIEAIDMGRRGLHNEAAQQLLDDLEPAIAIDFQTARQFFTLFTAILGKA